MPSFNQPNFTFPVALPPSAIFEPLYLQCFCAALVFQHTIFHLLSNTIYKADSKLKQRCWILTTLASLVMTIGSLPYLYDLFKGGFNFQALDKRTNSLSNPLSAFFVAYLVSWVSETRQRCEIEPVGGGGGGRFRLRKVGCQLSSMTYEDRMFRDQLG